MDKTVLRYQRAFNSIIERLKKNEAILAVMVFGSIISGDLWDESDIDLFVVTNKKSGNIRNIYSTEKEVPVHIKLMSKEKFIQFYDENLKGGFIHRIFASSKLVFSKDEEITSTYDKERYYPDADRERWSMVYLGSVLKSIGLCKKYLRNNGIYTAYSAAVKCAEDFSKLYINFSGYMISKDAMTMAMNLDDNFKSCIDNLFFNDVDKIEAINQIVKYVEETINDKLKDIVSILLNYMREKDRFLSSEEIQNDKLFSNFDIEMEEILEKLWEKNIIKQENRDYKTDEGDILFKENVYYL